MLSPVNKYSKKLLGRTTVLSSPIPLATSSSESFQSAIEQPSQPIPLATSSSVSFQSAMEQPVIIEMVNPSQPVASSTQHMALSSSQLTGI
ncbi:hypothetical protein Patl1_12183 [Pistacia atlantica]|uniref:Uncharacterized protein n=1 Tax=Pistacia atlantica TaxID=434234 RepID=A0ACC1A3B4_9ROSI|nr:hypothetical protein Patl1_12183 [Pistacia atlantica]